MTEQQWKERGLPMENDKKKKKKNSKKKKWENTELKIECEFPSGCSLKEENEQLKEKLKSMARTMNGTILLNQHIQKGLKISEDENSVLKEILANRELFDKIAEIKDPKLNKFDIVALNKQLFQQIKQVTKKNEELKKTANKEGFTRILREYDEKLRKTKGLVEQNKLLKVNLKRERSKVQKLEKKVKTMKDSPLPTPRFQFEVQEMPDYLKELFKNKDKGKNVKMNKKKLK